MFDFICLTWHCRSCNGGTLWCRCWNILCSPNLHVVELSFKPHKLLRVYYIVCASVGSWEQHIITAIIILSSCHSGNWSQKPVEVGGKAKGGSTAAASGSHSREEDATREVNSVWVDSIMQPTQCWFVRDRDVYNVWYFKLTREQLVPTKNCYHSNRLNIRW